MARRSRTAEASRPARALVRDMTPTSQPGAMSRPEVILDARPAIDFLVSLMLDTDSELLPQDRTWFTDSRASLAGALRRDFARVFGDEHLGKGIGGALVGLVIDDERIRSSANVAALASRVEPTDLLRSFSEVDEMKTGAALALRVLAGEPELRDEALAGWPDHYRVALGRLLDDPEGERRALRRIVRAWQERFAAIEERITAMGQRDVEMRRADLERLPFEEFVERTTGGVRWVPEPGVRRLLLSPSYFARPYNYVFAGRDWHMFAYPLAEAALDGSGDAVPAASIRLFKALADESRLRILRLLASGDLYLTEIADRMSLSKPTISHHLAQLRAAGLVTITQEGSLSYYSLRRDRVSDAGIELARFIGGQTR